MLMRLFYSHHFLFVLVVHARLLDKLALDLYASPDGCIAGLEYLCDRGGEETPKDLRAAHRADNVQQGC